MPSTFIIFDISGVLGYLRAANERPYTTYLGSYL